MKTATSTLHKRAEKTGIVYDILKKRTTQEAYQLYLRNLYVIYNGLEKPLSNRDGASKTVAPFFNEMLQRSGPIYRDLAFFSGFQAWQDLPILPSALTYRQHIDRIRTENTTSLLGHVYVRYLGDMNGGQVLERLLAETLNLPNEALNFYRFPAIKNMKSFRQDYRALFTSVKLSSEEHRHAVNTAVKAFELNIALSEEINTFVRTTI